MILILTGTVGCLVLVGAVECPRWDDGISDPSCDCVKSVPNWES